MKSGDIIRTVPSNIRDNRYTLNRRYMVKRATSIGVIVDTEKADNVFLVRSEYKPVLDPLERWAVGMIAASAILFISALIFFIK